MSYSTVKKENIGITNVGPRSGKFLVIIGRTWFDAVNGNSYFSASVNLVYRGKRYGFNIPYEYGYGDSYEDAAYRELSFIMPTVFQYDKQGRPALWQICNTNKIIFIRSITEVKNKKML